MAVAETASSSKSASGTSKARRRPPKCFKAAKSDGFSLLKVPLDQWIRAQAAIDLIVFTNPAANQIKADVGGSLKIESLADQSSFTSNQKSMSASASVGGGSTKGTTG